MPNHVANFDLLKSLAEANPGAGAAKVAAMLTLGKQKFFGFNSMKSHPFQVRFAKNNDAIFLHAEIDAIKNAVRQLDDIESLKHACLYVARVKKASKNGPYIFGDSKPCKGCQRCIAEFGIKKLFYVHNGVFHP